MCLYSHGDEAYIVAMTPAGYEFRSFPRTRSRGGVIGFVTRTTMSACASFRALDYRSFEAVELRLSLGHVSVVFMPRAFISILRFTQWCHVSW